MTKPVMVAGVQLDVALGQVETNLARIEDRLRRAASGGAKLIVFPECALSGYCFTSLDEALPHAQPVPGPATDHLTAICQELDVWCVFGLLEREDDRIYNVAVLVGPDGVVGKYRKNHLPGLGVDRFVTPGEQRAEVLTCCDGLRVAMNICYDGSFPEAARCLALEGADLIVLPTNWPPGALTFAKYLVNARALENNIFYLAVNRVGTERNFRFIGLSRLADTNGNDIALLDDEDEGIIFGQIDPEIARNKHLVRVPGQHEIDRFRDRRPQLYGPILETNTEPLQVTETPVVQHADSTARQEQLWAPWRLAYVTSTNTKDGVVSKPKAPPKLLDDPQYPAEPTCFLCQAAVTETPRDNLLVTKSERVIVVLNRFPYNNGHLLIAPALHKSGLVDLSSEEKLECLDWLTRFTQILSERINAEGFNVGLNLGRVAGAGVPGHLHWHIVPRWNGDTNFMPSLAGVRVIPQSLDALWEILSEAVAETK
jgi:predicted amidohydrolase/diadenosine tetraphosphate (Ap4A) HIT family hydrolase